MIIGRARRAGLLLLLCSAAWLAASWSLADTAQEPAGGDLLFSHRKHLARAGTTCLACHGSIASSREAADINLPSEETCLACHDGKKASKECALCHSNPRSVRGRPAMERPYRFNHEYHIGLGNIAPVLGSAISSKTENACLACHRGILETDLATSAHLPRMADCLVCHTRIDPPFSCKYCHTPEFELKPASHTLNFADIHSNRRAVPDKSTCKVCHGVKFTCMGCH